MLDRIRELLAARELSSTQFADTIGVSRPVVSHILSGRNKPSLEVVQKIVAAFPDLSLPWLLNGEGAMVAPVTVPAPAPATASEPIRRPSLPTAAPLPVAAPVTVAAVPQESQIAPSATPEVVPTASAPAGTPVTVRVEASEPVFRQDSAAAPTVPVAAPASETAMRSVSPPPAPPAGADLAQALSAPDKHIRRIVIFYQDGTFADYQPEIGI